MNMKKMIMMTMVALMAFSMVACSKPTENEPITSQPSSSQVSSEETSSEPDKAPGKEFSGEEFFASTESILPKGTIDGIESQEIGDEKVGFASVPSDWQKVESVQGEQKYLQYISPDKTTVLTLDYLADEVEMDLYTAACNVAKTLEAMGLHKSTGATVEFKDYKAYEIYGEFMSRTGLEYYDSAFSSWLFEDENGKIRHVSTEGTKEQVANIVAFMEKSYSVTK